MGIATLRSSLSTKPSNVIKASENVTQGVLKGGGEKSKHVIYNLVMKDVKRVATSLAFMLGLRTERKRYCDRGTPYDARSPTPFFT